MNSIDKLQSMPVIRGGEEARRVGRGTSESGKSGAPSGTSFDEFLRNAVPEKSAEPGKVAPPELKFSAHAQTRMQSRGIELSPEETLRMREALQKADAKGSKESLILTDKAAFVVSVKNGTVITAVDRAAMKENVFTNIDSTIMI